MSLDSTTVRNIAYLARIEIHDGEVHGYAGQLSNILQWIEQLGEVDTDGVDPMSSVVDMTMAWREDAVTDGGYADALTANAPERHDGFFAVPKVVE